MAGFSLAQRLYFVFPQAYLTSSFTTEGLRCLFFIIIIFIAEIKRKGFCLLAARSNQRFDNITPVLSRAVLRFSTTVFQITQQALPKMHRVPSNTRKGGLKDITKVR